MKKVAGGRGMARVPLLKIESPAHGTGERKDFFDDAVYKMP